MEHKKKFKLVKCYNRGSFAFILELKERRETFTATHTSYTSMVTVPRLKINYFFIKESGGRESMLLSSKIKSEIKKSEIHVDNIRSQHVKYFNSGDLKPCKLKKVYNVDITDCYPTTLNKLGFITNELFELMKGVEKIVKLKAIGQIATRKTVYEYVDGVATTLNIKCDEHLRNVWFTICHETGESIYECQQSIESFLFFWFDGIYFTKKSEAKKIIDILTRRGYKSKYEELTNFEVRRNEENIRISYNKDGKTKNFCLPLSNNINY